LGGLATFSRNIHHSLHYRCPRLHSRDIHQSPLQSSTISHKNAGERIPGRISQQQCWSTRVKARLQSGSWRKISDIKSSGTNDISHWLNPKSRNEGKATSHRIISTAREAPSADHICFYVFTTLALSTHGNHWRSAQPSHGTSSRLGQPAVLSNINWARPESV
jgi:hypothetical protein